MFVRNNAINQTNDFRKIIFFPSYSLALHARISDFLRALVHFRLKYQQKQSNDVRDDNDGVEAKAEAAVETFFSVKLILYIYIL